MSNGPHQPTEGLRRKQPARIGRQLFLMFLGFVTVFYGVILAYHTLVPRRSTSEPDAVRANLLERCRELCLAYGLVPTGHIANDAKAYLRSEKAKPLFNPLHEILADEKFVAQESQPHSLLGKTAPDFELPDDEGKSVSLKSLLEDGPVVVVFYYGYHCNHCVGQLFGLNEDLPRFIEMGTRVVAISGDPPELTAKRFAEYGRFEFPVLSDKDNQVAQLFSTFRPESVGQPELLLHGTFVIDSDGTVLWTNTGNKPFLDNKTLLTVIAKQHGLMSAEQPEK
jgi:thioredoxin-dependent peroxiredoxin